MDSAKKRMGRPPAGGGKDGEPERVSDFPKLTITIRPITRARLNAASTVESRPAWQIVDEGVNLYIAALPPKDRKMVEDITRRTAGSMKRTEVKTPP